MGAAGGRGYALAELAALTTRFGPRPVGARDLDPAEFGALLLRQGVSPWWVHAFTGMFESVRGNRFEAVTGDVATPTGRAAPRAPLS